MKASEIRNYIKANYKEAVCIGEADFEVNYACDLSNIKPNSLIWIKNEKKLNEIAEEKTENVLVIAEEGCQIDNSSVSVVYVKGSKACFFGLINQFFYSTPEHMISTTAVVKTNQVGDNVHIGDFTVIDSQVVIGNNVVIGDNVSIQCPTVIGDGTVISSGVVIGTRGYGYYENENGEKIPVPHIGGVVIGRNVEIGANTCVDRGTLGDTVIEDGVKIDNLCHIAHNVHIGKNSMIIAQSMLGGSCDIGEDVYVAPGVLIINQCKVEKDAFLGMGAVVTGNVEENKVVVGVPAKAIRNNK